MLLYVDPAQHAGVNGWVGTAGVQTQGLGTGQEALSIANVLNICCNPWT
jgi:hypothetical protein